MAATLTALDNQLVLGSLLTSGSSNYRVQSFLGQGTFGKVVKCKRLDDKKTVAIKMIKLQGCNVKAANQEVATLKKLRSLNLDTFYLVQWNQCFVDRGHMCLEFEHLDKSLFDFMKERHFRPLLLKEMRPIVQQIAHALNHLKAAGIVHADLKFDNVMLVDQQWEPFRVKVIDFGLACEVSAAKLGSYIQTRPYRSPEVMLGHPFTEAIDMWSLGCIAAAMYLGTQLYPGLGEYEMITYMMETQGQLPDTMLNRGGKTPHFFTRNVDSTASVWELKTPDEYRKETGMQPMENRCFKFTSLDGLLHIRPITSHNFADKVAEMADVHMFVDMLKGMLQLDPDRRITPLQVLEHKFISMRHITSMERQTNYGRSCFERMQICKKKVPTSGSGTAVCGPLKPPRCTATNPVQQNPPSCAEGRKTDQPHHTDLHACTTTQIRGTEGSRKRKIEHDDVPPHKKNSLPSSNSRHDPWHTCRHQSDQATRPADHIHNQNKGPSGSPRTEGQALSGLKRKGGDHGDVPPHKKNCLPTSNSRHDPWHTCHHQSDQATRPAEQHHNHNTGPSGSTQTEGQALSGLKRKGGDHGDVPPPQRNSLPCSDSNRRFQVKWDYSRSRDYERIRDRHDFAGKSICRDNSWHTRHHQSGQRSRPYEHHHHHNTGPTGCTQT